MTRTTAKYLALLALAIVLFNWKTLLTNQFTTIVGSEAVDQTYGWLHFWVNSIWHGHAPLWDPYEFGGRPFAGEMQTAAYYPIRLLFALMPLNRNGMVSPRFYHEYLAFARFLGACFMFGLLREFKRSHFAAFIGAMAFSMGGMVGRLPWPHYMESCTWIPAVVLFLLRALRAEGRGRAFAEAGLAGVCVGMSILTGGVQFSMMQGIVVVTAVCCYGIAHLPIQSAERRSYWLRLAAITAVILAVAFGIGAPQLFTANEYSHLSLRSITGGFFPMADKIPYDRMDRGMWPHSLITSLFPANGQMSGGEGWPFYIGVFPMFLAVTAMWKCWSNLWVRYFSGLALIAFLYTLGEYSSLYGMLYALVPYLWMVREPARFSYLVTFALAVLAAFGLDALLDGAGDAAAWAPAKPFLKWIAIAGGVVLFVPGIFTQLSLGIWPCLSILLILASCAWFLRLTARPASKTVLVMLAGFLLFDLSLFNWNAANRADVTKSGDRYQQTLTLRPAAEFVKAQPGLNRVRVEMNPEPNVGSIYGVQSLWGGGATVIDDYAKLNTHEDLFNVRYRIRPATTPDPGAVYQDALWKVYEDAKAYPRAWLVHQTLLVPSHDDVFQRIDKGGVDLHNVAIVERRLPRVLDAAATGDSVRFRSYEADSMAMDVKTTGTGLLVLSEVYYPGWKATVNGKSAEIYKVDGALRGVVVPAGTSRVVLDYVPASYYAGAALSLITALCVLLGFLRIRRQGRPPTGTSWVLLPHHAPHGGLGHQHKHARLFRTIQIAVPFGLFACLAGDGITKFFGGDDVMNLYKYYEYPISHWVVGVVHFWSSAYYRPLGGVVYLALFRVFGFHALPFKSFLFAALVLSMILYLQLVRKLAGSIQVASWALLLCCYHAALNGLYLNFGTIYDILGYSCFFGALFVYITHFSPPRRPRLGLVLVLLLYIPGLCSKEMVVTLPAVLFVYNVVLSGAIRTERLHWPLRSGLPVVACSAVAAFYTFGKMRGPDALAAIPSYTPHFTAGQYGTIATHYMHEIFYLPEGFPAPGTAVLVLILTIVLALLLRSSLMLFSALSAIFSQLPVSFIGLRGAFVIYIPFAFWALYAAALVDSATPVLKSPLPSFAAFLAVAAVLVMFHVRMKPENDANFVPQMNAYRDFSAWLDRSNVHLSPSGHALLVNDPFPVNWIGWDALFLMSVRDHTTDAIVNRLKFATTVPPEQETSWYDFVIDYDTDWRLLKRPGEPVNGAGRLRKLADDASVLLLDGFGPPVSGGWRPLHATFAMRTKGAAERVYELSISLAAQEPVRLSEQLDEGTRTAEVAYAPGNIRFDVPIRQDSADQQNVVRFWARRDAVTSAGPGDPQWVFVDAALHSGQ